MPSPRMSKSLEMIRSYKEHAPGDQHRRIERIALMYERHEIPSRKLALHICSLLAAMTKLSHHRLLFCRLHSPMD